MSSIRHLPGSWIVLPLGGMLAVLGSVGALESDCAGGAECQNSAALDDVSMLQTKRKLGSLRIEDVKPRTLACNSAECTFPPSQQNVKLGMASSGGGGRALGFFVGVLRGLKELGWDESEVLMNLVSGSSWAAPYIFSDLEDTQLLGEPTTPDLLSLEFLGQTGSEIGLCQSRSSLKASEKVMSELTPPRDLWRSFVASTFLEPFGVLNDADYMAGSEEDVKRIKETNPSLRDAKFVTPRPGKPSVIFQATLVAPKGFKGGEQSAVCLQMSPDYVGSPFYPDGTTVTYKKSGLLGLRRKTETRVVGGGFVETFAFGSKKDADAEAAVVLPEAPFTLGHAMAAASWAPGGVFSQALGLNDFDPLLEYWPISSSDTLGVSGSASYQLGDGGLIDNSAMIALLQRKISKILFVANNEKGLSRTYPWDRFCQCGTACIDEFDPVAAGVTQHLTDKFGYGNTSPLHAQFLEHTQVFESTEMLPMACELWDLVSKGRPAVVSRELEVLKNSWWGIEGGFKAQLTVIYLEASTDFNKLLPQETQEQISLGKAGMFANFPMYLTTFQNPPETTSYTLEQVNLLSAYGQWVISESAAKLRPILGIERLLSESSDAEHGSDADGGNDADGDSHAKGGSDAAHPAQQAWGRY